MNRVIRDMKIENLMNEFLVDQGFIGLDVVLDGGSWCYDENARMIYGCVDEVDKAGSELFMKYCRENGLEWDCPSMIMSLMHEVYHDVTRDFFDDFSWNITDVYVGLVSMIRIKPTEEELYNYFNSPREKTATINAIMFVNDKREYIKDLLNDIEEIMHDE